MRKRVLNLLLIVGFMPFFLFSQEIDWISPTYENQEVWTDPDGRQSGSLSSSLETYFEAWAANRPVCEQFDGWNGEAFTTLIIGSNHIHSRMYFVCNASSGQDTLTVSGLSFKVSTQLIPQCDDPNYQMGIDSDNLDGIDQCHPSSCPNNNVMWSVGNGLGTPTGQVCVVNPISGINCKYEAIENTDGSKSDYTFRQTGQGCDCSSELVPCADLGEGEITNYPQGQDGCTTLGDTIMCTANPDEKCNNGVCDDGCGYIGEDFYCVNSQIDPLDVRACEDGDSRPSCAGKEEGDCPEGSLNCGDNDGEGEGGEDGGDGETEEEGNSAIEDLLKQGNENTKKIADNTEAIKDHLDEKIGVRDNMKVDEDLDWQDYITNLDEVLSVSDYNEDQAGFESDLNSSKGSFGANVFSVFPSNASCNSLQVSFSYGDAVINGCDHLTPVRYVLEWALVLAFCFYLINFIGRMKP